MTVATVAVVLSSRFLLRSIMGLCWPDMQCGTESSIYQYSIVCVEFVAVYMIFIYLCTIIFNGHGIFIVF